MPEMNNENLNVDNNVTVVPTEPVVPVEPVVNVAPTVEIPTVEVSTNEVAEAPVVTVAPVEIQPSEVPVSTESVIVNNIPEIMPANNVVNEEPVITVTPDTVSVNEPMVSEVPVVPVEPVADVSTPVVDNIPVINTTPEVVVSTVEATEPVAATVAPVVDDIPVIETSPAVDEPTVPVVPPAGTQSVFETPSSDTPNTLVVNPSNMETPVEPTQNVTVNETPVVSDDNTIINSVVSDVAPDVVPNVVSTQKPVDTGSLGVDVVPAKKEGKKIGLVIALGVVAIILGVVLAFYFFVYNKPSMMFKASIKTLKTQLNGPIAEKLKPSQFEFSLQTKINTNNEMYKPLYNNLTKLSLDGNIYLDLGSEIEFLKLNAKYQEKDLISLDALLEKDLAYIKLNDIFDKYINTNVKLLSNDDNSDIMVVAHGILDALDKSLKEDYFTKLNKTVELGGVVTEVVANTLVINGENIGTFANDIVNVLKNNKEFLTAYANISKFTSDDVVKMLDELVAGFNNLSNEQKNEFNYQMVFYTKGIINKPVGFGVSGNGQAFDIYLFESNVTAYTTVDSSTTKVLEMTLKDDKYDINIYSDGDTYSFMLGFKEVNNPSFTKPDVTNSVTMMELTEDDYLQIAGRFMKAPGASAFMTDFEEVIISLFQGMLGAGIPEEDELLDTEVNIELDDVTYLE